MWRRSWEGPQRWSKDWEAAIWGKAEIIEFFQLWEEKGKPYHSVLAWKERLQRGWTLIFYKESHGRDEVSWEQITSGEIPRGNSVTMRTISHWNNLPRIVNISQHWTLFRLKWVCAGPSWLDCTSAKKVVSGDPWGPFQSGILFLSFCDLFCLTVEKRHRIINNFSNEERYEKCDYFFFKTVRLNIR